MKKIIFVFIFIMMCQFIYSQSEAMRFFTMGFNARNYFRGNRTTYFLYGYKDYSEAIVSEKHLELSIGNNSFYTVGFLDYSLNEQERYNGQNNSIGYQWISPGIGYVGEEHKIENGRLVYWAMAEGDYPYLISERIEHNNQRIIIDTKDRSGDKYQVMFYNVSKNEILDLFLKNYLKLIIETNEMVNKRNIVENQEYITPLLSGRTPRELAIFRNCLYAIKGYKFSNSTWTDFFNKYLDGYNGRYTNDEVTAMFTKNEKWLLDLII
ncbi:YARHG domain-containing protein, partial [Treponema sp. R6D11]